MSELQKKVSAAINRLKTFEPPEGYYLAFSGGKDSVVCKALADMAGIKYDAHYNVTSVDPPELVYFIKRQHPDVQRDIPKRSNGRTVNMWMLIRENGAPLQQRRFCCQELKERGGDGRIVITGVRWAESTRRTLHQGAVVVQGRAADDLHGTDDFRENGKRGVILTNDNTETRKLVEQCAARGKVTVNPIIDWTDAEVWEFIRSEGIPYCCLYDEGWHRLGCIGCPMANIRRLKEFARWPAYERLYKKAFADHLELKKQRGTYTPIGDGSVEDFWHWWLRDRPLGQTTLEGFE